jgi:ABC-type multidrug transport system fused ATPase/permease subunit
MLKAFPVLVSSFILVQVFLSVIPFGESYFFSKIVDGLIDINNNQWFTFFIYLMIFRTLRVLFRILQRFLGRIFNFNLEPHLTRLFTYKIASLDLQHLEDKDTANLIAKTRDEYQWRFREVFTLIFDMVIQLAGFGAVLYILVPKYWYLLIIILLGEIPSFLVNKDFNQDSFKFFDDNTIKNRQLRDLVGYLTSKNYLSELKINQSISFLKSKFEEIQVFFTQGRINMRRQKLPKDFLTDSISLIIMAVCLLLVINDIKTGLITVGMFTFYYNTLRQAGDSFSAAINDFVQISDHTLYLNNFQKILSLNQIIISGSLSKGISKLPKIEFREVSFKYPHSDRLVFKNLNLTINSGEEIALVGINGAGKSTLIKLLCRFYDPTEGDIFVDGINLKQLNMNYWHKQLSVLFQEFTRYPSLTLEDNIKISSHTRTSTTKLKSSLKKADSLDLLKKYKDGLNTYMSQRYGGEEPSWGQWQKIAISRIFYRNSPIMILDEPTASIDAVSESKIFDNLYKKVTNKTIIIVSHRFSTVRNAQRIIVLSQGKIIEEGDHDKLMSLNGEYAQSFNLQAQGYQSETDLKV